jgi:predicted transcriptional regulator
MEEIVQRFINSQPNGVKITEMEETLRQSRLRLGYVTRKLLNEGKVVKVENKYYPNTSEMEGLEVKK